MMKVVASQPRISMEPLPLGQCVIASRSIAQLIEDRLSGFADKPLTLSLREDFWPSAKFAAKICSMNAPARIVGTDDCLLGWISEDGTKPENCNEIKADDESLELKYPWQMLDINQDVVGGLSGNIVEGDVRDGVHIEGFISVGKGTVILPGVFIEGNVVFGRDCKIGPNCYFRGPCSIGDRCHIGQAVEVKNSILMEKVSAGHLSYVGDSIIGAFSNLGAGTITANFRHDGKNHRSEVDGIVMDTGRRKFGTVFGEHVHTGIHTSIYPGRKIWPGMCTLPADIVKRDIKPN